MAHLILRGLGRSLNLKTKLWHFSCDIRVRVGPQEKRKFTFLSRKTFPSLDEASSSYRTKRIKKIRETFHGKV
jgi:hypothetical protein